MVRLDSSTVLQVNATVIAGLLVLFTIQALSANTLISKAVSATDELILKQIERDAYEKTINQLKLKLDKLNDSDAEERSYIKKQISDANVQLYLLNAEVEGFTDRLTNWQKTTEFSQSREFMLNTRVIYIIMVSLFAASAIFEIISTTSKNYKSKEDATPISKVLMFFGFISILAGLTYIFSSQLF
jgi:hypothetical protein